MKYTTLPGTDIKVSKICLGTMTFGNQNTEQEGFDQMDLSLDQGVNFFDTAELYPVPANATTQGETERIMGNWFQKTGNRSKVVLATKAAGPGSYTAHIRDNMSFDKRNITEALDNSLKRLKTDYIDLYQLHWPERMTNFFGQRGYVHNPKDTWTDNFEEALEALDDLIKAGKIRHIGISNESPWGLMRYLELSKKGLPKAITIQNPYSLLTRVFEIGNSEMCMREEIGLLAYSPLGFGRLTGKYRGGHNLDKARLTVFPNMARYNSDQSIEATEHYYQIAKNHGISLTQMALAFVNQQPFLTSNIIGVTNLEQLQENIGSIDLTLSKEIMKEIEAVHNKIPNPAP
ncbi:aldo/keto reductase [Flavobacteriaceae bacterium]|uniref:aldo/keto reductase n=1 Tax=Candidatus Arcticimaribacter forsetii TaxID=2820661 RepID=UPI0020778FF5|nr:aldo/keto reductase [Candidatus Arcticimaribacter forsetii]MDA8699230.1 aldo/keto reductase [Flavobacteriaceae bacterium]MDB2326157.1 aldo/keto reductase [Flavobacteriaceae bacterium]MDB2329045.1 aldo/keto reductase [Flavobacteriaceae bacterium]MDB2345370.1 aldo/keto reductase [Flavobacteriaceae bacterium]MDB4674384.1 aldo/keto reductase [Flavobacteriaceae bacterium]